MISIKNFLWVGLGGGIGAMMRFLCAALIKNGLFPYSTFFINVVGSFLIGIIMGFALRNESFPEYLRLFLAAGICGGFTTFSAFSFENVILLKSGNYAAAFLYIAASVILCIAACFIGFKIANH